MIVGHPRFAALGQLPENFEKLSTEQQAKIISELPPEDRKKALFELFSKLPPEKVEELWRRYLYAYRDAGAYGRNAFGLLLATAGTILYDGFLLDPADRKASGALRTAAFVGSIGLTGTAAFYSYKVFTNPVSPDWAKIISSFVGVFSAVGILGKAIGLFSRPGTPAPVFSPMTSVAAAISGRKGSRR